MKKIKLKPCPFCGGKADVIEKYIKTDKLIDAWMVFCRKCKASSDKFINKEKAIQAWNKRQAKPYQ